ncbi:Tuberous sclerosis 2-like protein [Friedmanniomyces endolithicus]|uniref:Tuberous sclerosis 2-like protein n=1 Tax=Friedmanniomyces endolithicus TaxID=329885 RepID=A0AAN6J3K3_9PEZI|nr:Tuberous sclerosis 2-like protein [Friedmanniomyces endolithicus]
MDFQDGSGSSEQRPASSQSDGLLSVASGSLTGHSPVADDVQAQLLLNSSGSMGTILSRERNAGRDIAPFEATVCEEHTADLRLFLSPDRNVTLEGSPALPTARSDTLDAAIQRATSTIRYNAKWFAPGPVGELLGAALEAAGTSSSSVALDAALNLLDTITTYTFLPADRLPQTARFLAQAYYNASRANKTKKVAKHAWLVVVNLLRSHLGPQLDETMINAIGGDLIIREDYAAAAGMLMLLSKRLRFLKHRLQPPNVAILMQRLRFVSATTSDSNIMERIVYLLGKILRDPTSIQQIQQNAAWSDVLKILSQITKAASSKTTSDLLREIAPTLSAIEPRLLLRLAWVYVHADLPLTESLSHELRARDCSLPASDEWQPNYDVMLELCKKAPYVEELRAFVESNVLMHRMGLPSSHSAVSAVTKTYLHHIIEPSTTFQARTMLTRALIRMCMCSALSPDNAHGLQPLFDTLCTVSVLDTEAAIFLFSIRADVTGALYIMPTEFEDPPKGAESLMLRSTPELHKWRATILGVFRDGTQSWEVYNMFLQRTRLLLSNHTMFIGQVQFIKDLQEVICEKVESGHTMDPPLYSGLGKSYVAAQLVQTLVASMSYHRQLSKQHVTALVAVFDTTAGSRDYAVSIECIHALTTCCYEVPDLMTKYMDDIIDKMSRLVTQRYLAIHVLQFLAGLSRLPELYRNFAHHDYKKIFAVDGKDVIEDQGMVTIDMMDRVDADELSNDWYSGDPFAAIDGRLVERHRLVGMLLVSTKTSLRTGRTLVTVRRPSGTTQRLLQQGTARVTVESEDEYLTVLPDDIVGRTYGTITIPKPSSALGSVEILTLPEDDVVRRLIGSLDRTSALDSHKAGFIYIGEAQTTEDRIFRNISGSSDFKDIVRDLGDLEEVKGATFNTQGLDRVGDNDGPHVIIWRNQVTELVFHITTMMPNSDDVRENTGRKKRHVGNDHVNIVFNNSGGPHDFTSLYNIFPGQFTYVYIVVTPSARTSFIQTRTENIAADKADRFYSVQVVTRPDYPNISSAAEEKVVSGASLPGMLRNLALNECIMSLMWRQREQTAEYPSSWRSRLHQLRRLGERYRVKWV